MALPSQRFMRWFHLIGLITLMLFHTTIVQAAGDHIHREGQSPEQSDHSNHSEKTETVGTNPTLEDIFVDHTEDSSTHSHDEHSTNGDGHHGGHEAYKETGANVPVLAGFVIVNAAFIAYGLYLKRARGKRDEAEGFN